MFFGAAMLAHTPSIGNVDAPVAADVRSARNIALELARAAIADTPVQIAVTDADIDAAGRVLSNGLPGLRIRSAINEDQMVISSSYRLSKKTWFNSVIYVREAVNAGYPLVAARLGAVPLPVVIFEPLLVAAHRAAELRARSDFPTLREAIVDFQAKSGMAVAVIDLPRGLLKGFSKLAPASDAVDGPLADRLYARAMATFDPGQPVDLAEIYAHMLRSVPADDELARTHARSAMVAAAMLSVGPRARRLARNGEPIFPVQVPATRAVTLAGREDLAKHFALSAALAAAAAPDVGKALGTWKELDDSLAGGSGFSFVDLAADRAGLRLGKAVTDAARASAVVAAFQQSAPPELLPMKALQLEEGLSEPTFASRYGRIDSSDYAAAEARIDRALDMLPIMRP